MQCTIVEFIEQMEKVVSCIQIHSTAITLCNLSISLTVDCNYELWVTPSTSISPGMEAETMHPLTLSFLTCLPPLYFHQEVMPAGREAAVLVPPYDSMLYRLANASSDPL